MDAYERDFLNKFGEDKSLATFLKELITIRMENEEKVKDINK